MNLIIKKYKILNFSEKYFSEVLSNLIKFQKKAKMPDYERGEEITLREEIENATYTFLTLDTERNKIQWFGCFEYELGKCSCSLMFNNIDYEFRSSVKQCEQIMNIVRKLTNTEYISSDLRRNRMLSYKKYLNRYYNVKFIEDKKTNENIRFYKNIT